MAPTSIEAVKAYLVNGPFAASSVHLLQGGTANFLFRIVLETPYEGRNTVALKHTADFLKGDLDKDPSQRWHFDSERQEYEVEALIRVHKILPKDSTATVPEVFLWNKEDRVVIMEDTGEGATNLKEFIQKGGLTGQDQLAQDIGRELGLFLARVHEWGITDTESTNFFAQNELGKVISDMVVYKRLWSTMSGKDAMHQRGWEAGKPPVDGISEADLEALKTFGEERGEEVLKAKSAIVHGDFWTGNIVANVQGGVLKKIYVLDWYLSKTGLLGLDLGQFAAEIDLISRFQPEHKKGTDQVLMSFVSGYNEGGGRKHEGAAQQALGHWGGHLIAWTPRNAEFWKGDEAVKKAMIDGMQQILTSKSTDVVAKSVFGPLVV
ncbi:kinase-like domain-containing protein [Flagelloscypha sp. PMI_526]|nr:kinase-like domain-containing protein [Flagelloscypha sp. PMI_526]